MTLDASVSRPLWEAVERFHALTYMAPEVREEGSADGLKGFWMNYFATRIAPVGPVDRAIVESTFFYYAPARVHRAIPDAWSFSTPEAILEARYRGMDRALRGYFVDVEARVFVEAADLVHQATARCDPIGRTLYAGWASLEWPAAPHLALWHGCTLLREYRSGNHLIAICAEGLSGIESIITHVAVGGAPIEWIQDEAGWSDDQVSVAVRGLQQRGWLDANGDATEVCHQGRARVEALTDALDFPIWEQLGETKGRRLFELLSELDAALPPDDQLDWEQIYDH